MVCHVGVRDEPTLAWCLPSACVVDRVVIAIGASQSELSQSPKVPQCRARLDDERESARIRCDNQIILEAPLRALGFTGASFYDGRLGAASATKMCRSVMIKGLEAMVIESFTAARAYGVEDAVLASLKETFPGVDWEAEGTYFFSA